MTSLAVTTQGTKLYVGDAGSPPNFQQIVDVTNVPSFGGSERPEIDVSNMDSSSREFRFGLADTGSVDFELNYVPDNTVHTTVEDAADNNTRVAFKVELSDGTRFEGEGWFVTFNKSAEVDNVYKATVSFKWAARPTKYT
jgi:hypothetical protein